MTNLCIKLTSFFFSHSCKEEVDPFDTTIAGQVIPELADKVVLPETEVSSDPTTTPELPEPEEKKVDKEPAQSPIKEEAKPAEENTSAWPSEPVPPPKPKPVDEVARKYGRARPKKPLVKQLTDEDFDPRAS